MSIHVSISPVVANLSPIPKFSIPTQKGLIFVCNAQNAREVERDSAISALRIVQNMYTVGSYLTHPAILLPIQFTVIAIYSYAHFPFTSLFTITKLALYCMELALTTHWTQTGDLQRLSASFAEASEEAATALENILQSQTTTVVFTQPVEIAQNFIHELHALLPVWGQELLPKIAQKVDVALSHAGALTQNFISWVDRSTHSNDD